MAFDTDGIVERRRLRRRVGFWRVAALVCAALALIAGGLKVSGIVPSKAATHVARVSLNGIILDSDARHKMLEEIGRSPAAAVILDINSPGGGVAASEALYQDLRELAAYKPVVAVMGSLAASGGYVAALGADHIIARQTSLTGSIGVLMQYPDVSRLLNTLGITMEEVKSAPLKAEPGMFKPTTPEARAAAESLIMDSFNWFKDLVAERRELQGERLERVVDGRAFTGRQALEAGLIDEIGGEAEARAWLEAEHDISSNLPVRDWEPKQAGWSGFGLARGMASGAAEALGMPVLAERLRAGGGLDGASLDGLVAIWQPHHLK